MENQDVNLCFLQVAPVKSKIEMELNLEVPGIQKSTYRFLLKSADPPFFLRKHHTVIYDLLHSRCHNRLENNP